MAILSNGLLGNSRKSIANVVTYTLNGQNVARTKATNFKDANTVLQQKQRTAFAKAVDTARLLLSVIRGSYSSKKLQQSGYNAFISSNLTKKTVFLPDGTFVPEQMEISKGSLLVPEIESVNKNIGAKTISVDVSDNTNGVTGFNSDTLQLVIYDKTNDKFTIKKDISTRQTGTVDVVLNYLDGTSNTDFVAYLFYMSDNKKVTSDSVVFSV